MQSTVHWKAPQVSFHHYGKNILFFLPKSPPKIQIHTVVFFALLSKIIQEQIQRIFHFEYNWQSNNFKFTCAYKSLDSVCKYSPRDTALGDTESRPRYWYFNQNPPTLPTRINSKLFYLLHVLTALTKPKHTQLCQQRTLTTVGKNSTCAFFLSVWWHL